MAGLMTVFIKIHQRKTAYYLLRVNAWFAIIMLVAASCIHWDETIARYNLARKNNIALDVKFLLSLSDKVLPVLQKNMDVLDRTGQTVPDGEGEYLYRSSLTPRQVFENRKTAFYEAQKRYTWLSWNMADDFIEKELTQVIKTSLIHQIKKRYDKPTIESSNILGCGRIACFPFILF